MFDLEKARERLYALTLQELNEMVEKALVESGIPIPDGEGPNIFVPIGVRTEINLPQESPVKGFAYPKKGEDTKWKKLSPDDYKNFPLKYANVG